MKKQTKNDKKALQILEKALQRAPKVKAKILKELTPVAEHNSLFINGVEYKNE